MLMSLDYSPPTFWLFVVDGCLWTADAHLHNGNMADEVCSCVVLLSCYCNNLRKQGASFFVDILNSAVHFRIFYFVTFMLSFNKARFWSNTYNVL